MAILIIGKILSWQKILPGKSHNDTRVKSQKEYNSTNQLNLLNIYRTLYSNNSRIQLFFSSVYEVFPKIDYILKVSINLKSFKTNKVC